MNSPNKSPEIREKLLIDKVCEELNVFCDFIDLDTDIKPFEKFFEEIKSILKEQKHQDHDDDTAQKLAINMITFESTIIKFIQSKNFLEAIVLLQRINKKLLLDRNFFQFYLIFLFKFNFLQTKNPLQLFDKNFFYFCQKYPLDFGFSFYVNTRFSEYNDISLQIKGIILEQTNFDPLVLKKIEKFESKYKSKEKHLSFLEALKKSITRNSTPQEILIFLKRKKFETQFIALEKILEHFQESEENPNIILQNLPLTPLPEIAKNVPPLFLEIESVITEIAADIEALQNLLDQENLTNQIEESSTSNFKEKSDLEEREIKSSLEKAINDSELLQRVFEKFPSLFTKSSLFKSLDHQQEFRNLVKNYLSQHPIAPKNNVFSSQESKENQLSQVLTIVSECLTLAKYEEAFIFLQQVNIETIKNVNDFSNFYTKLLILLFLSGKIDKKELLKDLNFLLKKQILGPTAYFFYRTSIVDPQFREEIVQLLEENSLSHLKPFKLNPEALTNNSSTNLSEELLHIEKTLNRLQAKASFLIKHKKFKAAKKSLEIALIINQDSDQETKIKEILTEIENKLEREKKAKIISKTSEKLRELLSSMETRKLVKGVSIDAYNTREIDDCIWVETLENCYKITVSIADVASHVAQSAEEHVLIENGEKVTKVVKKPRLLPQVTRQDMSLNQNTERLTMSVVMEVNFAGQLINFEIEETRIENERKLSYSEVTRFLQGQETKIDEHHKEMLLEAAKATLAIRKNKFQKGKMSFLKLSSSLSGYEVNPNMIDSEVIIAEFMILANHCVAKFMLENNIPGIFRNNLFNKASGLKELLILEYQEALAERDQHKISFIQANIRKKLHKSFYDIENHGHQSLALEAYTHSTSPIRRSMDVLVWKQVKAFLKGEEFPYSQEDLENSSKLANKKVSGENLISMLKDKLTKEERKRFSQQELARKIEAKKDIEAIRVFNPEDGSEELFTPSQLYLAYKELTGSDLEDRETFHDISPEEGAVLIYHYANLAYSQEFNQKILSYLKSANLSSEVLTKLYELEESWQDLKIHKEEDNQTLYIVIENEDGEILKAKNGENYNFTDKFDEACYKFIKSYLEKTIIIEDSDHTFIETTFHAPSLKLTPIKNLLLSYCETRNIDYISFQNSSKISSYNETELLIMTTCKVIISSQEFTCTAVAHNLITAEEETSKKMLETLSELFKDEIALNQLRDLEKRSSGEIKSLNWSEERAAKKTLIDLQQYCKQQGLGRPKQRKIKNPNKGQVTIQITVSLGPNKEVNCRGVGNNKKEARQRAVEEVFRDLLTVEVLNQEQKA